MTGMNALGPGGMLLGAAIASMGPGRLTGMNDRATWGLARRGGWPFVTTSLQWGPVD